MTINSFLIVELLQVPSENNERSALLFAIQSDPTTSKGKFSYRNNYNNEIDETMRRNWPSFHLSSQTMRRNVTNNAGQEAQQ